MGTNTPREIPTKCDGSYSRIDIANELRELKNENCHKARIRKYFDAYIPMVYRRGNYISEYDAKLLDELDAQPQRIDHKKINLKSA